MSIAPPPEDFRAPTLERMVLQIQRHAQCHGYAVTKKRTKNDRLKEEGTCYLA